MLEPLWQKPRRFVVVLLFQLKKKVNMPYKHKKSVCQSGPAQSAEKVSLVIQRLEI